MPRNQPQYDRNRSQRKTYIMRNQDLTRSIVAGMRKLVLSLARARNQGGWHFVSVPATTFARAGSKMIEVKSYLYVKEARESSDDLPTKAKGPEGVAARLKWNGMLTARISGY